MSTFAKVATSQAPANDPAVLVIDAQMRVRLRNAAADALLSRGIVNLDSGARIVGALAVRLRRLVGGRQDEAPVLLQGAHWDDCYLGVCVTALQPASSTDDTLFVLIVRDARAELHARSHAVARRHGLTDSEERLLLLIVDGLDPGSAARKLGVARSTVRTHLQRVFEKVGVSRQSELVAFIARVSNVENAGAFWRAPSVASLL